MSDESALKAIEDSVVAAMLLVDGMESADAVPLTESLTITELDTGGGEYDVICRPPKKYPGCNISLNDKEIEVIDEDGDQAGGTAFKTYKVPVFIAIYAYSDGAVMNSARYKAWHLAEEAERRLMVCTPSGLPEFAQMMGPLDSEGAAPLRVDANTHGMLLKVWARYRIMATLSQFG
jgi:hypothetical protein